MLHWTGNYKFCLSRGMDTLTAGKWTSLILVLISVILTGWNIYPTIAKFGGAGALVPITGFANGVAAPAIEFKKKVRYSESEVRFFPLADRLFCTVFSQAGCWDWCTGSGKLCSNIYFFYTGFSPENILSC